MTKIEYIAKDFEEKKESLIKRANDREHTHRYLEMIEVVRIGAIGRIPYRVTYDYELK